MKVIEIQNTLESLRVNQSINQWIFV